MKITKRVSVGFSEDDFYIVKGRAKELKLSMSAYLRMKAFASAPQFIPSSNPLPRLNRPPRPPIQVDTIRGNMVHVIIELKEKLANRRKIVDSYEEEILREVEIK